MDEAARGGDEIGVRLHQRELVRADHAARPFVERAVDRHEVRAPQQLVERHLDRAARGDRLLVEIRIAGDDLHAEETTAELGDAAAAIAEADEADVAPLDIIAHEAAAVVHGAASQGVFGLNDLLGEHQHHGEHVRRHRLGIAAGLVDDEHAGVGAVLDVDGIEAGAVGGDDEQVRHAVEQLALDMEARLELVARRSDLVGVRGRHDRSGDLLGSLVLELVEPDLRPLRDDVEIAGVRDVAQVEHALHVVLHFLKVLDHWGVAAAYARLNAGITSLANQMSCSLNSLGGRPSAQWTMKFSSPGYLSATDLMPSMTCAGGPQNHAFCATPPPSP